MSFELEPHYDNPFEQTMLDVANIIRFTNPEPYESDAEVLFALLVRGTSMYVRAWQSSGDDNSLGALVVTSEDLADPDRIHDPNAAFMTQMDLTLDAIGENIEYEVYPFGRPDPPSLPPTGPVWDQQTMEFAQEFITSILDWTDSLKTEIDTTQALAANLDPLELARLEGMKEVYDQYDAIVQVSLMLKSLREEDEDGDA